MQGRPKNIVISSDNGLRACARAMEISLCGLSELAVLSLEHPDELPRSKRDLWQARLLNVATSHRMRCFACVDSGVSGTTSKNGSINLTEVSARSRRP